MRRFAVLPYAPQILMNEPKEFEHREHPAESPATKLHGARTKALATAKFWSFAGTVDGKGVRVIVRQVGNGNKHFFSIFETGKTKQANDGQF
jgi:hypothetical protein